MATFQHKRAAEETLATLARRQHGVVTRPQLIDAGFGADTVDRNVRMGRFRTLHRGIYLAGPLEGRFTREMAAVLACGPAAVLSHRSAARAWTLIPPDGHAGAVEVIIPPVRRRCRPGVAIHRTALRPAEITTLEGVPLTTPTRTLLDLASALPGRDLERALAMALDRDLTSRRDLAALSARRAPRPGSRRLSALLAAGPVLTRSEAEEAFLALIRKAQVPAPAVNTRVHGYEVDFYWKRERFAVEIDGFAFHSSRRRFETDRRRDAVLAAAGVRVVRVTWSQIAREPEALLVRLAQALVRGV